MRTVNKSERVEQGKTGIFMRKNERKWPEKGAFLAFGHAKPKSHRVSINLKLNREDRA